DVTHLRAGGGHRGVEAAAERASRDRSRNRHEPRITLRFAELHPGYAARGIHISTSLSGNSSGLTEPGATGKCCASTAPHCSIAATNPSPARPSLIAAISDATAVSHTSCVTLALM